MAYLIEHEWEKGQTITAEKLNHMEKGIAAAIGAIENAFGKTYTDGANEYKVSLETLGSDRPITAGAITGTTLKATDTESESALDIAGASTLKGDVNIGGALTVGKNENGKTKDTTLNGKLSVNGQLTATGISNLEGGLNVGTASTSKDTTMHGELTVEGVTKAIAWDENNNVTSSAKKAATLNGLVNITGDSTINGDLTVGSSQNRATIKLNDAMTVKFSNNKNQIIIDGYTKINESFQIGDENNNKMAYIYGSLNIMEFNSLTHRPTASITLSKDTRITAETLTVNTGTTTLRGTTTIDKLTKLIVGDSTSTEDNKIYGFTTISDLTVSDLTAGAPNVGSPRETQTYSGIATFNTEENFLHGHTTIDYLTTLKVLSADEAHWIHGDLTLGTQVLRPNNENPELSSQTAEDDLKINSRNITIGLQSTSEYPVINANSNLTIYAETSMVGATEIQNLEYLNVTGNSNNFITGSTTITNLTVPSFVVRDQTTTNGGYAFTISNGTNLRLSQNNGNNNNFDFYFKDTGELIFSGAGYFDNVLTLKNNLIFETESSNQSTSYNYIIKPSLSSANHYSLQMNINKGSSDIHTILTYYDNTEEQTLYLGNSVSNNTMSSTVTKLFLEAKDQIVLQGGEGNGVEVDSNLYLQSGKELRLAKSNTQNDYVILTAAQLEQIKSYCNITD